MTEEVRVVSNKESKKVTDAKKVIHKRLKLRSNGQDIKHYIQFITINFNVSPCLLYLIYFISTFNDY